MVHGNDIQQVSMCTQFCHLYHLLSTRQYMEVLYRAAVSLNKPSGNQVASVENIVWSWCNKLACSVAVATEKLQGFDESQ